MTDTLWWRSWGRLDTLPLDCRDALLAYVRSQDWFDALVMESLYRNKSDVAYSHRCADFDRALAEALDVLLGPVPEQEEIPF